MVSIDLQVIDDISGIKQAQEEIKKELLLLDDQLHSVIKQEQKPIEFHTNIELSTKNTKKLLEISKKSLETASSLTMNVRQLHEQQSKISNCLEILSSIQELHNILKDLQNCQDLQLSCDLLNRFLKTPCLKEIKEIYNQVGIEPGQQEIPDTLLTVSPVQKLEKYQQKVLDNLMESFDLATQKSDSEAITSIFKNFPKIGMGEIGLDKLSAYVCSLVSKNVNEALKKAIEKKNHGMYVDCLVLLFEAVAGMIDRQQAMVDYYYGKGSMVPLLTRLTREADVQSCILLNSWSESRQIQRKVDAITRWNRDKSLPIDIDLKEVDIILGETATVCSKARLFDRFITIRVRDEMALAGNSNADSSEGAARKSIQISDEHRATKLNDNVQSYSNTFVLLGDFYIQKSIAKAFSIDAKDPDSLTTSCVDDVFYIIKSTLHRGVTTSDPDCLCALINSIYRALEEDFMSVLQNRLVEFFQGLGASGSGNRDDGLATLAPILNNIDTSCTYIVQLTSELERQLENLYSHSGPLSIEQIKACLSNLTEYAQKTRQVLKTWLENWYTQTIKPKFRNGIAKVTIDSKYVLSEEEYRYDQSNFDSLPKKFYDLFKRCIVSKYEDVLTSGNHSYLASLTFEGMLKEWESRFMQLKFNSLGSLKLEKESRSILQLVTKHCSNARELIQRVNQICLVVGLENIEDVLEIWGVKAGSIRWRLSSSEVKKVLGLR